MTTSGTPPHTTRETCGGTTLLPRDRCSRGSSPRSFPKEHRHERDRHRDDGRTGLRVLFGAGADFAPACCRGACMDVHAVRYVAADGGREGGPGITVAASRPMGPAKYSRPASEIRITPPSTPGGLTRGGAPPSG